MITGVDDRRHALLVCPRADPVLSVPRHSVCLGREPYMSAQFPRRRLKTVMSGRSPCPGRRTAGQGASAPMARPSRVVGIRV